MTVRKVAKVHRGPPYPKDTYENKASYQKCWVQHVSEGQVWIRLEPQGTNGFMPIKAFLREYRKVKDGRFSQHRSAAPKRRRAAHAVRLPRHENSHVCF